jgi:hypothetical protein
MTDDYAMPEKAKKILRKVRKPQLRAPSATSGAMLKMADLTYRKPGPHAILDSNLQWPDLTHFLLRTPRCFGVVSSFGRVGDRAESC